MNYHTVKSKTCFTIIFKTKGEKKIDYTKIEISKPSYMFLKLDPNINRVKP